MTDAAEFGRLLGFTPAWSALGVVDDAVLAWQRTEWDKGEDDNTEHYRYWAFREFLAAHRPLAPELAAALFELGESDPDWAMGGSIMADIVHLPECPPAVLNAAVASGRKHLIRIVERRRAEPSAAATRPATAVPGLRSSPARAGQLSFVVRSAREGRGVPRSLPVEWVVAECAAVLGDRVRYSVGAGADFLAGIDRGVVFVLHNSGTPRSPSPGWSS